MLAAEMDAAWSSDNDLQLTVGGRYYTSGPDLNASTIPIDAVQADPGPAEAETANLFPTAIHIVDGNNNLFDPEPGQRFFVRVEFTYDNPTNDFYSVGRVVNENPQHLAPNINWGSGLSGRSTWYHVWGGWVMHHGGTYQVTVQLDPNNAVAESNEADNFMTRQFTVVGDVTPEWALVGAEQGQALLGDGTDVIVGSMDDALDFQHPWLTGNDSLGRPRLIAADQNTDGVDGSPLNSGHATAVMGIVLARGNNAGDYTGLAPDARYVTAEFINRANVPGLAVLDVADAAGFLVEHGAEVINMSWSWWFGSATDSQTGETSKTGLMVDYLSYGRNIVAVPAVNQLPDYTRPTAPGSSRNVITVGGLNATYDRAWNQQDHGPTLDGRGKPDLLGNTAVDSVSTNSFWRDGRLAYSGLNGTSFAAPFVTGAIAQMLDYGKRNGENLDHRVIKAVVMNSAVKTLDDNGAAWSNTTSRPLDDQQGTGLLNIPRIHRMYSAGQQSAGIVGSVGYDFAEVQGTVDAQGGDQDDGRAVYQLGEKDAGGEIDVTLTWDRHTFWNDVNANDRIDAVDSFYVDPLDAQDNLDLVLYRDGLPYLRSESTVDTVEHLHAVNLPAGEYEIHVLRKSVANSGDSESYALAWNATGDYGFPPTVQSISVNHGLPSRSQVTSLEVEFDQQLELAPLQSAFLLENLTTGLMVENIHVSATDVGGRTVANLRFSGDSTIDRMGVGDLGDSLADGNYRLTINAASIRSLLNIQMATDHLFGAADSEQTGLFRWFGDTDGDRDVDGNDIRQFGLSFLARTGDLNFDPHLDQDGDGDIDSQDYGHFSRQFRTRLRP
ncbi:S8 family serine peptidase [Stieleria sp. TO1_6]|uniref:S8 family peptidase n=1 Tax=Stieleria tagensis TaxID=2956795 RepID=UPI00209B7D91|nr:S8 family serine peptidase [Stieleria tagensis]MCO8120543.1 S8 family serine peptidase [Stieleria tagensis]